MTVNLFDAIPNAPTNEEFFPLLTYAGMRIERIVSKGHKTPEGAWYDQDWAEWVLVTAGAAELTLTGPDEVVRLQPGDSFFIPPHRRHRVTWTDPANATVWLAVHWPSEKATIL